MGELVEEVMGKENTQEVNKFFEWVKNGIPSFLHGILMVAIALVLFVVGRKLINLLVRLLEKSLSKSNIDQGVLKFLNSFVRITLTIILVVVIAGFLGLETTSLAAVIGSAGLAIGLSLQGSLANFAGGVLILVLKPFIIGDYIIANGHEGNVIGIDIFYTKLRTGDNKCIVIPNGVLSNGSITNVTREDFRRVDITVGVGYSQNIKVVKDVLIKIANANEFVDKERSIDIFVDELASSSVNIGLRVWTAKENYWTVKWGLLETIKEEFDKEGISIPFDQLDVCIKKEG